MNPADRMSIRNVVLERLEFAFQQSFSRILQEATIDRIDDIVQGNLLFMLRAHILAQRLDEQVVCYPADWWQAFKARFFPSWLLRHWPVLETVKTMRMYAWYPDKVFPSERSPGMTARSARTHNLPDLQFPYQMSVPCSVT